MKKRILSLLLTLVMILGMIPATTLTANAASAEGDYIRFGGQVLGTYLYAGEYLEQGAKTPTTTKPADNYAYYDGTTLELHNFATSSEIYALNDLVIRLFGYNKALSVGCYTFQNNDYTDAVLYDLVIEGNGTLVFSGNDTSWVKNIHVKSGHLVMSSDIEVFYKGNTSYHNYPEDVTYPKNAIALCSRTVNGTWEPFDLDKVKDKDYQRVMIIGAYFGQQSPAMPEGKTEHDLGKVSASEYVMTFASQDMPSFQGVSDYEYKVIEQLVVYDRDNNDEIVDTVTNDPQLSGTGISYSLKNLPLGNYRIRESIILYDKDGKELCVNNNDFILEVGTPEINFVKVNGESVADGGTVTVNKSTVTINTNYDNWQSQYGSVNQYARYYLNGNKINVAMVPSVDNGDGTATKTITRSLTAGDELRVESWLEITWPDGTTDIVDEHTITVKAPTPINTVNVSATFSGTPANATSNTDGITVTGTQWYRQNGSTWTALTSSDTIKEGYTYRCEVTVDTTDGYPLADDYTVKINGTAATKLSGNTWYVDKTIAGIITLIDVMDIYLPEAGITPDFTCTWDDYSYDDEIYEVEKIEWFKSNASGSILSDALPADYVFEEDSYYLLKVTIKPKDGWILYQTGFYINGEKVENDGESGTIGKIVYHTNDAYSKYTVKIDDVTMKDGDYLAWGATAVTATQPSDRYAYYKDGVLTLNNWNDGKKYPTENGVIEFNQRHLKINLVGENYIETIKDKHDVYGYDEDGPYWLTIEGNGSLYLEGYATNYTIAVDGTVSFNGGYIEIDASLWGVSKVERIEINGADVYFTTAQDGFSVDDSVDMVVYDGTFRAFDAGSYAGDEWLNINFLDESAYRVYAGSSTGISNPREVQPDQLEVWTGTDFTSFDSYDLVMASVVPTHTVTFKVDTTTVATKTVEDGKTVTAPADPTQSGKTFLGWYNGSTKFDFTTPITGDITLTAKFEDVTSTVKLGDVNGDDTIDYADIQCIYQHMSTDSKLTGDALIAADVNKDGAVDYGDIQRLYQHLSTDNKLS